MAKKTKRTDNLQRKDKPAKFTIRKARRNAAKRRGLQA